MRQILDKRSVARRWRLWVTLHHKNSISTQIIEFAGGREEEALRRALQILQECLKRKQQKGVSIWGMLLPAESTVEANELFRTKRRLSNRRLLRIKDPYTCFVRGYGPQAAKEIDG